MTVKAYGANAATEPLQAMDITRRSTGAHDVQIDIAFCGVCHSDIHQVRAEWAGTSPQVFGLIMKRRSLAGSMIGGIRETQEMLDFCAEHGIVADIELIRAGEINDAYERMLQGDVKYRFVIDNATLAA
jgi:D-arabinose 1-dehydrogenase-like Zn-dependent alcohol dehydrogenase